MRLALSGALIAGCAPEVPAPEVLYVGCAEVRAGSTCERAPEATLRLWAPVHRDTTLVLEIDGEAVAATWVAAEDGLRAAVVPDAGARELVLRDADAGWRWRLALRPASASASASVGMEAEGAFRAAVAGGRFEAASSTALQASFSCTLEGDFRCAERWLERQARLWPWLARARLHLRGFYVALLADRRGDYRAALRAYTRHAGVARALGLDTQLAAALSGLGVLRGNLGDTAGAEAAFAELFALEGLAGETLARAQNSAGWMAVLARAQGRATWDPEPLLAAALRFFETDEHADRVVAADARANLAYAALLRGDPAAAAALLAPLEPSSRATRRWKQYLEGRIELALGRPAAALQRFDALIAEADAVSDRLLEWGAEIGAGEALEAMAQTSSAIDRYRRAAALHAASVAMVAIDARRERFAAEGDRGAQRLVRLLVREGRVEEAACAARQARVQAFAGLAAATREPRALAAYSHARDQLAVEAERSWDLPRRAGEQARARLLAEARRLTAELDAALAEAGHLSKGAGDGCARLRGPGPGELLLVYFPVERGHVGFALDAEGVVAAELAAELASEPMARAQQLLGPFAAGIERAERVRVIASGALSGEAFHALPWGGAPLIERAAVAYSLDLPGELPAPGRPGRAVQLAPPSNLGRAAEELAAGAEQLRARGVEVTTLVGVEADLRARLGAADLLHYVGHARGDGWDSALDLGGGRELGASDLISAEAPAVAVLGGCETGLLDPRAHAGGMSLAHALLLAGAGAVLATDAKVDDELPAQLTPALLAALADGVDPAEALRRVQRARMATRADWSRFRAFVR